jgi:hypothetical protein
MESLDASLHQRYCRYLGVCEMLALTSTCRAARDEWLPANDPLWWGALLRLACLEGDGVAEATATAEYITAKVALLRLGPLVLFRQNGVIDEGCMQYAGDEPVPETILGFIYVKDDPAEKSALRIIDPALRIYFGTDSANRQGEALAGPEGSVWQVKNAAPGMWVVSVRRRQMKYSYPQGHGADHETDRVCKYLCGFHERVLTVRLPQEWKAQMGSKALQKLSLHGRQSPTVTVEGGLALGAPGDAVSVLSERPEAFYLGKFNWRPTMLALVDQSHLWFDTISAQLQEKVIPAKKSRGKKKQKTGAARCCPTGPRLVVGWHLQVGGAQWEG